MSDDYSLSLLGTHMGQGQAENRVPACAPQFSIYIAYSTNACAFHRQDEGPGRGCLMLFL